MTLMEAFARDEIFIDFGYEPLFGTDQVYVGHPCRFATVTFKLIGSSGLIKIADRIRKDRGYAPLYPMDEYTAEMCDLDGWYVFSIGINDFLSQRIDSYICFDLEASSSADCGETYTIDLTAFEQECIYERLDALCRRFLGKGCLVLLGEAKQAMEERK